jgi:hypothetical protein
MDDALIYRPPRYLAPRRPGRLAPLDSWPFASRAMGIASGRASARRAATPSAVADKVMEGSSAYQPLAGLGGIACRKSFLKIYNAVKLYRHAKGA